MACPRVASNLSNTGSPRPDGTLRMTQVTVPPMESLASFARMILLMAVRDGYLLSQRAAYLCHPLRCRWVRTSRGILVDLFSSDRLQKRKEFFGKCVLSLVIRVVEGRWDGRREVDLANRRDERDDLDSIRLFEVLFGDSASRDTT